MLNKPRMNAEGRTRTGTAFATAPSRQRVYQFHHFGMKGGHPDTLLSVK